ncbi:MAG TPA: NAD-dependent epimerase/dehydratase family protein [Noviherbaspirillum sp.]|nr:NAD-dependent epimerase/dehydratase family protein [Noviherbaspirillum sp.]
MEERRTALVLGATGGIGGEVVRQLGQAGWTVKAMARSIPAPDEQTEGTTWLRGDALIAGDVASAARGCSAIVHAVNPPGYKRWQDLVLPMLRNTIAAAEHEGATIVLPGTVYNYGRDAFPVITEDSPQHPFTRKGAIRVEMEHALQAFSRRGGRTLIVRAGDFFGPRAGNNWFSQGLVKPARRITRIHNPGIGIGHQWAYLPDVARTMVALLERRHHLEAYANFHMAGHWDPDGSQMACAIQRAAARHGGATPAIATFPWWLVRLASPFVETFREMLEMRYLWQQPVRMGNAKLKAVLGEEPHTPLDLAVESTLAGLGCIPPLESASGDLASSARS